MVAIAWGKRTGWQRVSDPILSSRVLLYISCCKNGVYWRKHTLMLHRTASTAAQSAQMWFGGKSVPPTPHPLRPTVWFFIFPLWTLLLFACWLSLRGGGRSWLLTHYFFSTWVLNSCQDDFFSYHSVLNQNSLLNCPLSSQISRADRAAVSRDIHALDTL